MPHSAHDRASAIARFFEAESVALVGASEREGSLGAALLENLGDAGFKGAIYAINPRHKKVRGRPCFASLRDVAEPVDLAVVATPAAAVPRVLEDCAAHGTTAAVVLSAGFREAGDAGRALEQAALDVARRHGIRFLGPNCLGIMRPAIGLNATFSQTMAKPGHIALVSQSGALCTAMLDWAAPHDVGFSGVVSSGTAADIDFGEILDYLVTDPITRAIMLYIEGIRDARRFMSALRAAARAKPVIVMKGGRHAEGVRAAVSHTGALVGADDVFDAALSRAGVVRVYNYTHLFAIAETLHAGVRTGGPRLAIVTNGGGPGVMAADFLADERLPLATLSAATRARLDALLPRAWSGGNPVDVLGDSSAARYADAVSACLDDPGVDGVLAILVPQALTEPEAVARAVIALAGQTDKPLLTCWMGDATMRASRALLRAHGVPAYGTPEAAVDAFAAVASYQANQELLLQVPEPASFDTRPDRDGARRIIENALGEGRHVLDLVESKALLATFNVPVSRSVPARDATEAVTIATAIGFPIAMKIHSPDIAHKSDVDGVRLGVGDVDGVRATFRELVERARSLRPDAQIYGVALEPMCKAAHGRELMLGVVNDSVFGPVISAGLGGTLVEIIRDRALALPPLNRFLARRMIEGSRAARYLDEFRGRPAASREALEAVILRLSEMVCELPWIAELDVNPLIVDERGAVALDARVVVRRLSSTTPEYAHMAIHPYPSKLVATHTLEDGTRVTVRPIRPEDAALERDFVDGLSERSRYLRFMYSLKRITPQMLSQFTQIDYDREMALIALVRTEAGERQIAVARYVSYPEGDRCEFAIVVADEWRGKGIATELLRRLIGIARDRRLEVMEGLVLRENRNMLALAKALGFEHRVVADDPKLVRVELRL